MNFLPQKAKNEFVYAPSGKDKQRYRLISSGTIFSAYDAEATIKCMDNSIHKSTTSLDARLQDKQI